MIHIIKDAQNLLGTFVTITVVHPDVDERIRALRDAFHEIYRIRHLMSAYKESSKVGILNKRGYYKGASNDTKHVIQEANHLSERSDGSFDIIVLPLLEVWREKPVKARSRPMRKSGQRSEFVDYRKITVELYDEAAATSGTYQRSLFSRKG